MPCSKNPCATRVPVHHTGAAAIVNALSTCSGRLTCPLRAPAFRPIYTFTCAGEWEQPSWTSQEPIGAHGDARTTSHCSPCEGAPSEATLPWSARALAMYLSVPRASATSSTAALTVALPTHPPPSRTHMRHPDPCFAALHASCLLFAPIASLPWPSLLALSGLPTTCRPPHVAHHL